MDVGSVGTKSPSTAAEVAVFKKATDQKSAVVDKILSGIDHSRAPEQTGQRLNVAA